MDVTDALTLKTENSRVPVQGQRVASFNPPIADEVLKEVAAERLRTLPALGWHS